MKISDYALCKVEDVKDYLTINSAAGVDNVVHELINMLSVECEAFCGRRFISREYTETYNGNNTETLALSNYPIVSVSSLVIEENGTALTADEYYLRKNEGIIVLDRDIFAKAKQKIAITYTAGYTNIDALPFDLRMSVVMGIAYRYWERAQKTLGQTSVSMQGGEQVISRTDKYPEAVLTIWRRYRRPAFYTEDEGQDAT